MNSPPLWVFCLSFQGFFDHFLFSLGFASVFDQISIKIVLLKRNHLQITIKFLSAHIIRHLYYYFKPCWCKFCGMLEFSPWVLVFSLFYGAFTWVCAFFFDKCRNSKLDLAVRIRMARRSQCLIFTKMFFCISCCQLFVSKSN